MAPSARRNAKSVPAEVAFAPLKSCLVNLPSSLVNVLTNANTAAQDVIVEVEFSALSARKEPPRAVSIVAGWTGMPSKQQSRPVVDRQGIRRDAAAREGDIPLVEIDATFAHLVGLSEGQKIALLLHADPHLATTVNIEPLTSDDWEIIELHAEFLELNLLSQIRALPNPSYAPPTGSAGFKRHPLSLYLSPTSTANFVVTDFSPPAPNASPFAKISPDAEVIVAPKARSKDQSNGRDSKSITSTSKSASARHVSSSSKRLAAKRPPVFLRGVSRSIANEWFDDEAEEDCDKGLRVWIDRDLLSLRGLRGADYVVVDFLRPSTLEDLGEKRGPIEPKAESEQHKERDGKPARRVIARVSVWDDAPDIHHICLSSFLCSSLGADDVVGGLVRIEAAPPLISRTTVKSLKFSPYPSSGETANGKIRFGGEAKLEKEETALQLRRAFGKTSDGTSWNILNGPLTNKMLVDSDGVAPTEQLRGILSFNLQKSSTPSDAGDSALSWLMGDNSRLPIEVGPEIPEPIQGPDFLGNGTDFRPLNHQLVGVEHVTLRLESSLSNLSSILLTGGLGAGKTETAKLVARVLRTKSLFHTAYLSCRDLVTDEAQVSTIKDRLSRLFLSAEWGSQYGGKSLVILDDLDKICPAETELQVGGENGRSRHISELLCSMTRKYCGQGSKMTLLGTAQAKESMNQVIVGSHIVQDIVPLHAPDKNIRRHILEILVASKSANFDRRIQSNGASASRKEDNGWMEDSSDSSSPVSSLREASISSPDSNLDLLDIAGRTDGYMPSDLALLVSRAQSESLIRSVREGNSEIRLSLIQDDFASALEGFTPASLRNVTLETSGTTFDSIGGLKATRKALLETLQYPTTYAPIFAQCPLRLRSGLLLYGYPGCGKTMLASAVAGECGLNFISVKGPEILNKYIGSSEKSVRDLFERAQTAKPCVLFFDEFDSIAPKRGHDSTGVTDRVVNQLLTQMDGAEGLSGVYVLAATSRPDMIDPALLRPGRLDKSLVCDMPNVEDREDILLALSKKLNVSKEVLRGGGLSQIAQQTEGYSGADLQALMYNAQLDAIHHVLEDRNSEPKRKPKSKVEGRGNPNHANLNGISHHAQVNDSFLFDQGKDELCRGERLQPGTAKNISWQVEQTRLISQLEALDLTRRQARQQRRGARSRISSPSGKHEEDKESASNQVVIQWSHIQHSLKDTRPSIAVQDRARLEAIYREFVVGRNGEMPTGEGSTEVGGRSSLM